MAGSLLLASLGQKAQVSPTQFACIYAGPGEEEKAFEALDQASELRAAELMFLKADPRWEKVRTKPSP